jgi:flavin reductase (DIM6/NTAB) family NADH-FMN oxidoreductase RutF/pimeloyl-ACP methyl ester carboxylesterase
MAVVEFRGFAGIRLEADVLGSPDDPSVLLVHGGGQTRKVWADAAAALVSAGRQVINLDLRGHGASDWPTDGRYDLDAFAQDLRAVLAQMGARPVVVAASLGGWAAVAALGEDAAHLATGLVLADAPPHIDVEASRGVSDRLRRTVAERGDKLRWDPRWLGVIDVVEVTQRMETLAPSINIPTLFVRGSASEITDHDEAEAFVKLMPNAEFAEIEQAGHLVAGERTEEFNGLLIDFLERKIPRAAPEYRAGSDARTLRDALGCFATGVTIVTTLNAEGEPVGLVANSFTSVSLDPPLLLVCVGKSASAMPSLLASQTFAVNVLHIGQQPTSNRFTRKDVNRFEGTPWEMGETGAPLLLGSLTNFECERHSVVEAGDHIVLLGKVLKARFEPRRDPLLYFRGKYRRLHMG